MGSDMAFALRLGLPVIVLVLIVLYGLISFLIAAGVTKADRKAQEAHLSDYGLNYQEVDFLSRRVDVRLSGWFLPGEPDRPSLIFVHGIGSVRSGDKAVELAAHLVGRGFSVLLFDLRGHGSSEGDKVSGGYFEQWDVLGAFDFLVERGNAAAPDRACLAFQWGAATAVLAAAHEPAIVALVADSPYARASELIALEAARKTVFPRWITPVFVPASKPHFKMVLRHRDWRAGPGKRCPRPILPHLCDSRGRRLPDT